MPDVTVSDFIVPFQFVYVFNALDVHRQAFQAVRDFNGNRFNVDTTNLLEVGELRYFHAVQPNFPTEAPSAQGRRFPVIFYEANVVFVGVNPQGFQAL